MILILCVDERGGMCFSSRRQSRDRAVTERILALTKGQRLFVTPYTAKLFADPSVLCISNTPEQEAGKGDFYFAENGEVPVTGVERIHLFCWNRHYPSDRAFDRTRYPLRLLETREFPGFSHEKITEYVFEVLE